jgi:superoxide dismutase
MKNVNEEKVENLFETEALFIACPVSMDGKFKTKLNKEIESNFRGVVNKYKRLYRSGLLEIGQCWKVMGLDKKGKPVYILLMVTQKTFDGNVRPSNITKALRNFKDKYRDMVITSISFPILEFGILNNNVNKITKLFKAELTDMIIKIKLTRK